MQHPTNAERSADLRLAGLFTVIAGKAACAVQAFDCRSVNMRRKEDHSPVTAADEASQTVILQGLAGALPGVPVVSEEAECAHQSGEYILVDPLDGTKEFLAARNEYTVNIALVRDGVPVVGVVAAPALGLAWRGAAGIAERLILAPDGSIGEATAIRTRRWPDQRVAAVSRLHYDEASAAFIERFAPVSTLPFGSALKFCRIAEGSVDIYPRLAPTSEWDIAAGHALVVAAGGAVTRPDGGALLYGSGIDSFIVPGFVAWGDVSAIRLIV